MREIKAKSEDEAKTEAAQASKTNGGKYVTVTACFGLFICESERLHVFSPSDSAFGWYALNGKIKDFTDSQRIADQQATPALA